MNPNESTTLILHPVARVCFVLVCLLLAVAAYYVFFLPLLAMLGLNLVAALEPYIQSENGFLGLQLFLTLAARIFFFPFGLWFGYRLFRRFGLFLLSRYFGIAIGKKNPAQPAPAAATNPFFIKAFRVAWRIPVWGYLMVCIAILLVEIPVSMVFFAKTLAHPSGAVSFLFRCSPCHSLVRPLNNNMTVQLWNQTLDRMEFYLQQTGQTESMSNRQQISDFLLATRSYSDRRLLRSKCTSCHGSFSLSDKKRTLEQWDQVMDRIQRQHPFFITVDQKDQLVASIGKNTRYTKLVPKAGMDAYQTDRQRIFFERKCGLCHTLSIVLQPYLQHKDWKPILERMGHKTPHFLSLEQALSLAPLIEDLRLDPEAFASEFPHATMPEKSDE